MIDGLVTVGGNAHPFTRLQQGKNHMGGGIGLATTGRALHGQYRIVEAEHRLNGGRQSFSTGGRFHLPQQCRVHIRMRAQQKLSQWLVQLAALKVTLANSANGFLDGTWMDVVVNDDINLVRRRMFPRQQQKPLFTIDFRDFGGPIFQPQDMDLLETSITKFLAGIKAVLVGEVAHAGGILERLSIGADTAGKAIRIVIQFLEGHRTTLKVAPPRGLVFTTVKQYEMRQLPGKEPHFLSLAIILG